MSHDTPHAGVTSLSPEATRLLGAMQSEARERLVERGRDMRGGDFGKARQGAGIGERIVRFGHAHPIAQIGGRSGKKVGRSALFLQFAQQCVGIVAQRNRADAALAARDQDRAQGRLADGEFDLVHAAQRLVC